MAKSKDKKKKEISVKDLKLNKDMLLATNIKEKLNKLFYEKPNYDAELEMLKYQYDNEEEERYGLHASAIIGAENEFCYRAQVLSLFYRMAQGENIPIHLKRIYEEGKSIGTKWQRLFIRGGIAQKEDLDVSRFVDEYDLSYTPDAIINLDGKIYVVEIKSMNRNQWEKATSHPSGQKQLKLYIYFEGKKRKIDGGFVLADCKDNSDFKIFPVFDVNESDDDIADIIYRLEKIQRLKNKFIKEKKPPKRHSSCTTSTCSKAMRCPMRDACWGIKREKIKVNKKK